MEEAWEALDIDDTDLSSSSLLRRCTHKPPPSSTTKRRLIPGPAAAIQAAMHRTNDQQSAVITTQEYIRRVDQDAGLDFSRNPWLFAFDFLRHDNRVVDTTPLSSVKMCTNAQRFDKVVAIVKSCTPNGLGDMMVTLKDPTDTIGASIHGKVLSVGDFGKFITVGSVLILQKVVAFSSSCVVCYLNITRSNIDKVISVDCEVHSFPEDNLGNNPERTSAEIFRTEGVVRDGQQSKGKAVYEDFTRRDNYSPNSSIIISRHVENGANTIFNSGPSKWQGTNVVRNNLPCPGSYDAVFGNLREDLDNCENLSQAKEICTAMSKNENLGGSQYLKGNGSQVERLQPRNNSHMSTNEGLEKKQEHSRIVSSTPGMVESLAKRDMSEVKGDTLNVDEQQDDEEEARGASAVKKQRIGLVSRNAVQEWTDEQLSALDMDEY